MIAPRPPSGTLPVARTITVYDTTQRTVAVLCPYCNRRHIHGWPWTDRRVGTRVAHCAGGGDYRVVGEWQGAR